MGLSANDATLAGRLAQSAGGELGHGMKIAIVGNCQHFGLAACIRLMIPDAEVVGMYGTDPSPPLTNSDLVFFAIELRPSP